jgi:hypothetical protein
LIFAPQIQNIAYEKTVTVFYSVGESWGESQRISAGWLAQGRSGYETWAFSGAAEDATQFYIKYDVNGNS